MDSELYIAIRDGNIPLTIEFLDKGVKLKGSYSPIHLAAQFNKADLIVQLLKSEFLFINIIQMLESGIDNNYDSKRNTPLHYAARYGSLEACIVLLQHGANIDSPNKALQTPLHIAVSHGHRAIVRTLLLHGSKVNGQDQSGRIALHCVSGNSISSNWSTEIVTILLEHGANVNTLDKRGNTPLHEICQCYLPETVTLLLEHGANPRARNKKCQTPISLTDYDDIRTLLLSYVPTVEVKDPGYN